MALTDSRSEEAAEAEASRGLLDTSVFIQSVLIQSVFIQDDDFLATPRVRTVRV
jgi:hypothetical protein